MTIPTIWVAIALSLLLHLAVMWQWLPRIRLPSLDEPERGAASGQLRVRLAPPPGPPPAPPPSPAPRTPPLPTLRAQPAPRPPPAPPVIALNRPAPDIPAPQPAAPAVAEPAPARPPSGGDLAAYIEAQRRARAEPARAAPAAPASLFPGSAAPPPPPEDDNARASRLAAANLALRNKPVFGFDPTKSGGVFQIRRVGYDSAEFVFFGWNKEIRRNTAQEIEVRRGDNSDIRIAVVRRMIAIIREYEQGDFLWESRRLERNLMLSARPRDNSGLEEFMMREFFDDPRLPR